MSWFGPIDLQVKAKQTVMALNVDHRLELFYIGLDDHIYHMWQMVPNALFWSAPAQFSNAKASYLAVGANIDGRLELFYVGIGGGLYHNWQTAPANGGNGETLNTWVGETTFVGDQAKQICVAKNFDGRLEVFYVGSNDELFHNWQIEAANSNDATPILNSWAGQTRFAGNSAQEIAVGTNFDGRLEIFYVGKNNNLYHNWQLDAATVLTPNNWNGEQRLGHSSADFVTVARNNDGRLEIFYTGTGGHLYHNWQNQPATVEIPVSLNSWVGETPFKRDAAKEISASIDADGMLEIFYVGSNNHCYANSQQQPANFQDPLTLDLWSGQGGFLGTTINSIVATQIANGKIATIYIDSNDEVFYFVQVPDFPDNLHSNANKLLSSNGENLLGLSVVINITQDIVTSYTTGSTEGFGFQLNAWSSVGSECVWQQYGVCMYGKKIDCFIDNWLANNTDPMNFDFFPAELPDAKLPAGYQIQLTLGNDIEGRVNNVSYAIFNELAEPVVSMTQDLEELAREKKTELAPIVAFQLVLVGPTNSECTLLSSGAGNFIYEADNVMSAASWPPPANWAATPGQKTQEIANSFYLDIKGSASNLTQDFGVEFTSP